MSDETKVSKTPTCSECDVIGWRACSEHGRSDAKSIADSVIGKIPVGCFSVSVIPQLHKWIKDSASGLELENAELQKELEAYKWHCLGHPEDKGKKGQLVRGCEICNWASDGVAQLRQRLADEQAKAREWIDLIESQIRDDGHFIGCSFNINGSTPDTDYCICNKKKYATMKGKQV